MLNHCVLSEIYNKKASTIILHDDLVNFRRRWRLPSYYQ